MNYSLRFSVFGQECLHTPPAPQIFDRDGFKRCASLRLLAPFYPPIYAGRILHFDADTIVLCDPG